MFPVGENICGQGAPNYGSNRFMGYGLPGNDYLLLRDEPGYRAWSDEEIEEFERSLDTDGIPEEIEETEEEKRLKRGAAEWRARMSLEIVRKYCNGGVR